MPEQPAIDLSAVGPALWGANWQAQMAAEFNLNDRNVRRWSTNPEEMPQGVRIELNGLIMRRMRLMQERFRVLGHAIHSTDLAGETFGNFAEGEFGEKISDTEVRARCAEAAARAMMRGPAQGETSQTFAAFLMGLGNAFYGLAHIAQDRAVALRAIDAAATGMVNAKLPGISSEQFGRDVFTVATEATTFALGKKAIMGHDHLATMLGKDQKP